MPPQEQRQYRLPLRFPPEIVDFVLEELRPQEPVSAYPRLPKVEFSGDNGDLASCSLVCKQWRELSRRHLFHRITFTFGPEADVKYMRERKTLDQFVMFVSQHWDSTQYITELSLVMGASPYDTGLPSPSLVIALFSALSPSRRLQILNLYHVYLDWSDTPRCGNTWIACLPALDTLRLFYKHDNDFIPAYQVYQILDLFSAARTLQLDGVHLENISSVIAAHFTVSEVEIYCTAERGLISPIDVHQFHHTLRVLVIKTFGLRDQDNPWDISVILEDLGSTLEELHFDIYPTLDEGEEIDFSEFQLAQCIALRTVVLTIGIYGPDRPTSTAAWAALADIFTNSPPPKLEHLDLYLDQGNKAYDTFQHPPSIAAFEKALRSLPNLTIIKIFPCFAQDLIYTSMQSRYHTYHPSAAWLHVWIDPQLPIMLFAGMLLDQKLNNLKQELWIGGNNSLVDAIVLNSPLRRKYDPGWDIFYQKFMAEGTKRKNLD